MCALALLAIAAAPSAPRPVGEQDRSDRQPDAWRDTGLLPASADEQPLPHPGMVKVSVPEARRLLRIATMPVTRPARDPGYA